MFKILIQRLHIIMILILVIALLITLVFLYNNFYKTFIQASEVLVLKRQVAPVSLNEKLWNEVLTKFNEKVLGDLNFDDIKDPFKL